MKKIALKCLAGCAIACVVLIGCGGGGDSSTPPPVAVLTISSQGTLPAGTALSGCGLTITFPPSVAVQTNGAGAVSSVVVVSSGVAAGQAAVLISPLAPGQLTFLLTSTAVGGFGPGEFVKVYFTIVPGSSPQTADFSVSGFAPVSLTGEAVPGLIPAFTLAIE